MTRRPTSRSMPLVLAVVVCAVAAPPAPAVAQVLEPLPGSPYFVGATPLVFAMEPGRSVLFGFTPALTTTSITSYPLLPDSTLLPLPHPSFASTSLVQSAVPSPAGDLLYGATPTGVTVYSVGYGGALALAQEVSRDIDARPLKGIAYAQLAGGAFVYVNENTAPTNRVAIYRVLDAGLSFEGTVETGGAGNYPGSGAPSGIPSTPRIAYAAGRLFVLNGGSARASKPTSVSVFDVGDDGRLAAVQGSPFFPSVYAQAMLVQPDGRAIYLGTQGSPTGTSVVRYAVGVDGRVSDAGVFYPVFPEPSAGAVDGFALHPSGRWIVATGYTTPRFAVVDLETGETMQYQVPAGQGSSADVVFDVSGSALYVGTYGGAIAAYRFLPGALPPEVTCVGSPGDAVTLVAAPGTCTVTVDAQNGLAGACAAAQGEGGTCSFDGAPSATLAVGADYTMNVEARSVNGMTAACTSYLKVVERDPPALLLAPQPAVLWPPDHRMAPIDLRLSVVDACDPNPGLTCTTSSSEPEIGPGMDSAWPDISWDGSTLWLRSERREAGPGRTYGIACTATDASGNAASTSATVVVPHDASCSN